MKKVLFISNGYGEDTIAGKIVDRVRKLTLPGVELHGWPMVGYGEAYSAREIPVTGAPNRLPSCGFATMSWKLLWRDLRAGWIATHWRQVQAARRLRKQFDLAVVVGDIVPIVAACLARVPFLFIGCAKSSYYNFLHGYTPLEKRLLRRHCLLAFPRDELTVEEMNRACIHNRYRGNPMMDDLEGTGETFGLTDDKTVIALLPGSRTDAAENALHLLAVAAASSATNRAKPPLQFLFAVHPRFDPAVVAQRIASTNAGKGWQVIAAHQNCNVPGVVLRLRHASGVEAWFAKDHLADVLRRSNLVVGLAGTANEQAVGLSKPLITFATPGVQGKAYVKMKMEFFGEAALQVSPKPHAVAEAVLALLRDPRQQQRMIAAGLERMGQPGASAAIAEEIRRALEQQPRWA